MDGVVTIDQTPIEGSRRSNPATYTGALDPVRKAFARANKDKGAKPAHFSANSEGACPVCGGSGVIETQLGFMEDVGLGYLHLGQVLTTLSGGERQRLKLAVHLGQEGRVIVLDEPTVGLHPVDIEAMLALVDRIVDSGRSVVVIEHHQAVMANADWIIDLGPGAGYDGGRIVFTGTPAQMVADRTTLTGRYLAQYVEEGNEDDLE